MKKTLLTTAVVAFSLVSASSAFAASSTTTDIYAARGGLTVQSASQIAQCGASSGHCGQFNNNEKITVQAANLGEGTAVGKFDLDTPLGALNSSSAELMDQTDTCDAEYKHKQKLTPESSAAGDMFICY
jgi:hypothetical protein